MKYGDGDWTTPRSMALDYFQAVSAPKKEFITIRAAGRIPFIDNPNKFSNGLLETLNRIAGERETKQKKVSM